MKRFQHQHDNKSVHVLRQNKRTSVTRRRQQKRERRALLAKSARSGSAAPISEKPPWQQKAELQPWLDLANLLRLGRETLVQRVWDTPVAKKLQFAFEHGDEWLRDYDPEWLVNLASDVTGILDNLITHRALGEVAGTGLGKLTSGLEMPTTILASVTSTNGRIATAAVYPLQGFLEALNGAEHTRIRRCEICRKVFYASRTDTKDACSKSCNAVRRQREARTARASVQELRKHGASIRTIAEILELDEKRVRRYCRV